MKIKHLLIKDEIFCLPPSYVTINERWRTVNMQMCYLKSQEVLQVNILGERKKFGNPMLFKDKSTKENLKDEKE